MGRSLRDRAAGFVLLAAVLYTVGSAGADPVSFAGKRIEMFIGSTAGGGTDLSSRLVATYVAKHLPGSPTVAFRNMPGGQGIKALNHFATRVKPDGLALAGGSQGHIDQAARKQSAVQFDPHEFAYIGGLSRGGTVFAIRKASLPRLTNAGARPLVVPAVEFASTGPQLALWGREYLGWNLRIVLGYSGTPAMTLAAMQGEVDAMPSSSMLQLAPLLEAGQYVPFVQMGDLDDQGVARPRASLADVPLFPQLIEPKLPAELRTAFNSWLQSQYLDKWFALPPKSQPEHVAAYAAAFLKAVEDPEFIAAVRAQFGDDFKHTNGQTMTGLIRGLVEGAEAVATHMNDMRRKHGLPVN